MNCQNQQTHVWLILENLNYLNVFKILLTTPMSSIAVSSPKYIGTKGQVPRQTGLWIQTLLNYQVKFRTVSTSRLNLSQNAFTKKIRSRIYFQHYKTFIFIAPIVRSRLHNHLETGVTKSIFPFHEIKMGLGLDPYQSKVRLGFGSVSIFVLRYHNTSK